MIVTQLQSVYDVVMPAEVQVFLAGISVVISLGFKGFATTPLECMDLAGYVPRLTFWMLLPPVAIALVLAGNIGARAWERRRDDAPQVALFEASLPLSLKLLFLVYPKVASA